MRRRQGPNGLEPREVRPDHPHLHERPDGVAGRAYGRRFRAHALTCRSSSAGTGSGILLLLEALARDSTQTGRPPKFREAPE